MPPRLLGKGRCYLRRSSAKQESSLEMQLEYVIAAAKQHGVRLRASLSDLKHMLAKRLIQYKDIFLDDAVSGTRTKRPAFDAMLAELKADPTISHLLVHKRDRLGRPRSPLSMMVVEEDLQSAGVTIVTSEGVIAAGARGSEALGQSLTSLVSYYESGEFSRKLSERVVTKHIELASKGYSTGGIPPYGFGRFLERPDGTLIEIPMHQRHTERNCHIRFLPNDDQRIKVWIWILERLELAGVQNGLPRDSMRWVSPPETPVAHGMTTALSTRFLESGTRAQSMRWPPIRSSLASKSMAAIPRASIIEPARVAFGRSTMMNCFWTDQAGRLKTMSPIAFERQLVLPHVLILNAGTDCRITSRLVADPNAASDEPTTRQPIR